jgi:thiosulfate dehydrogenase
MNIEQDDKVQQVLVQAIRKLLFLISVLLVALIAMPVIFYVLSRPTKPEKQVIKTTMPPAENKADETAYWTAPYISSITDVALRDQVTYGKELIAHTSKYLGPNGSVLQISNGLNCQNCHLQAGTAVFGNNYGSVASLYPKFRARSGTNENIYKRVNDCFERSLNGQALDTTSKEMQAIVAYINFLGTNVEKGKKAEGSGLKDLPFLDRAADSSNGAIVYEAKCQSCHQANGEGVLNPEKTEYTYPALWGNNSFNDGAGLYRISNFAKYAMYNMPQGATHKNPMLTTEEAWDVAAYILSQPRPHMNVPNDWPDKSKKPMDHPFGPYADNFSEKQHKFGPFKPIIEELKKKEGEGKKSSESVKK